MATDLAGLRVRRASGPPDGAGGPVVFGGAAGQAAASSAPASSAIRAWIMSPALFWTPATIYSQLWHSFSQPIS